MWYFALAGIAHFAMMGLPGRHVVDIVCELPSVTRTFEPPVSAASDQVLQRAVLLCAARQFG